MGKANGVMFSAVEPLIILEMELVKQGNESLLMPFKGSWEGDWGCRAQAGHCRSLYFPNQAWEQWMLPIVSSIFTRLDG